MEIVDCRPNKTVRFNNVKIGDCFELKGSVYLKTLEHIDAHALICLNAVNLTKNQIEYIVDNPKVIPLDCKLVMCEKNAQ